MTKSTDNYLDQASTPKSWSRDCDSNKVGAAIRRKSEAFGIQLELDLGGEASNINGAAELVEFGAGDVGLVSSANADPLAPGADNGRVSVGGGDFAPALESGQPGGLRPKLLITPMTDSGTFDDEPAARRARRRKRVPIIRGAARTPPRFKRG